RPLLARAGASEVVRAERTVAVDDDERRLEDHALQRRRADDLAPRRVLRRALRRVLLVDLLPREVERALAEQPGEDAEDQPARLVQELHARRPYPVSTPRPPGRGVRSDRRAVNIRVTIDDDLKQEIAMDEDRAED